MVAGGVNQGFEGAGGELGVISEIKAQGGGNEGQLSMGVRDAQGSGCFELLGRIRGKKAVASRDDGCYHGIAPFLTLVIERKPQETVQSCLGFFYV